MKYLKTFESIFDNIPYGPGDKNTDKFITDSGPERVIWKNTSTGEEFPMPRYGVWATKGHRKPTVIDTGDNLVALLNKHQIPEDRVLKEDDLKK
jgi:hypothetical protein